MNREEKQKVITDLKEKFSAAKGLVITDYKGMTVAEMGEFRSSLRDAALEYRVVKNTLARIAAEGTPAEPARENFTGPVGIAFGYEDAVTVAKTVLEFAKKNEKVKVQGGIIDGSACAPEQLKAIASLPPRDVLLGMMAGTMQAPAAKMARLLGATVTRLGYALNALKDKKAAQGQA